MMYCEFVRYCDVNSNQIYIDTSNLSINDTLKIYDSNNSNFEVSINEINANFITVDKNINGSNCFVYGSKVNDFHTLDKSYIYTLNVCATQELYKTIQSQQEIINQLRQDIEELKIKIK